MAFSSPGVEFSQRRNIRTFCSHVLTRPTLGEEDVILTPITSPYQQHCVACPGFSYDFQALPR